MILSSIENVQPEPELNNEQKVQDRHDSPSIANAVLPAVFWLQGTDLLLITQGERVFTAGYNFQRAKDLVRRLNEAHRPNVQQHEANTIAVCWNTHNKGEKCEYVVELQPKEIFNKEDLWSAWWASAIKTISFTPIDKDYERRCFEDWLRKFS